MKRARLAAARSAVRHRGRLAAALACVLAAALAAPSPAAADALVEVRGTGPVAGVVPAGHGDVAVASEAGLAALRAAGRLGRVLVDDVAAQARHDRAADAAYARQNAT